MTAQERTVGSSGPGAAPSDAPAGAGPRIWRVSEINRAVRNLLERTLPEFWVAGEVGGWTRARSGHAYFTLKDEHAQLRCVIWRRAAARLPMDPEVGMRVRALGSLTVYEARGEYQFSATGIEAEGEEGLWRIAFEKLRSRLEAEGLLASARKRPLPRFPASIGVVTSLSGAALTDILTVIRRRAPWTRVVVRASRVQGEWAAAELADAIRVLGRSGEAEIVIVGRGGGSLEDLWAFNEEPVARAIAECPVPVVSAVGHEMDVTIADLVADLRAPTPSAAAEAVVPDLRTIRELLGGVRPRLARALRVGVERRARRVTDTRERVRLAMSGSLAPLRRRLEGAAGKLGALSPLSTLERGFAIPLAESGRVLRGRREVMEEGRFDLRVVDGAVACRTIGGGEGER